MAGNAYEQLHELAQSGALSHFESYVYKVDNSYEATIKLRYDEAFVDGTFQATATSVKMAKGLAALKAVSIIDEAVRRVRGLEVVHDETVERALENNGHPVKFIPREETRMSISIYNPELGDLMDFEVDDQMTPDEYEAAELADQGRTTPNTPVESPASTSKDERPVAFEDALVEFGFEGGQFEMMSQVLSSPTQTVED
ncbi:hypothetical protein M501DRAFT_1015175 [Patellaria atrata CBS 101060]|uniref:Uncharacterized protein n=1 Tax=Patellaria atrata CBS 101060 TaxID=1346257 RepID=A0A9P4SCE8_9PEZI|nr:hypothetical protein M501DRAFT_1015175 [Patellaria atrata CBS 101060]